MPLFIHSFLSYVFFILTLFFSFFVPGNLLVTKLNLKHTFSFFEEQALSWIVGVPLFLLLIYITAYLQMPQGAQIVLFILLGVWLYPYIRRRKSMKPVLSQIDLPLVLLIVIGSLASAAVMFFSGFTTANGIQFFATNSVDSIRHIAYINDQVLHFPPQEPSVAGEPLTGFHYFYDFILSRFVLFYSFSTLDLYFRYFPFFILVLYGMSFVLLTKRLNLSPTTQRIIIFLVYFSRSSALFVRFFNHTLSLTDDVILQPLLLIVNPFTVLSLALLAAGFSLLPLLKKSWKYSILISLLFGVLAELKVYSGIIAIICLCLYTVYLLIQTQKKYLLSLFVTLCITAIITAATFFPNNLGSGGLLFTPFLFFQHYMQTDLFTPLQWTQRLLTYQEQKNSLGIVALYGLAVVIFIVLNFGIRILPLFKIRTLFSKSFWKNDLNFILFCALFITFFIPTFFIQSISVFDTIQFFWIGLVLLCIPTGIMLSDWYQKLSLKPLRYVFLILIVSICLPGTIATLKKYTMTPQPIVISTDDQRTLHTITQSVPNTDFVTLIPPPTHQALYYTEPTATLPHGTPFIAALTNRETYYEEGWLPTKDETKYQQRAKNIEDLQTALTRCIPADISALVQKIGSPYIVTIGKYACLSQTLTIVASKAPSNGNIFFYHVALQN